MKIYFDIMKKGDKMKICFIKVNKPVYIAQSRQRHNITLNNFFLHVLNHALKKDF